MSGGQQTFKVVLLGEGCVGKTSCVVRYVEDQFNDRHVTTLQVVHQLAVTTFDALLRKRSMQFHTHRLRFSTRR